jgi:NADH dehydrogenase
VKLKDGRTVRTENVIWTAGARPSSLLEGIGIPLMEKTKGAKTDEYLRVEGYENVWAIGDNATVPDQDGKFVPPNAQAAVKEGVCLAENILSVIDGDGIKPFKFKSQGQLIDLGSHFAVNDVFGVKFSGWIASMFWRAAYLVRLQSPQGKVRQAFDWGLEFFTRPTVAQISGTNEE